MNWQANGKGEVDVSERDIAGKSPTTKLSASP